MSGSWCRPGSRSYENGFYDCRWLDSAIKAASTLPSRPGNVYTNPDLRFAGPVVDMAARN